MTTVEIVATVLLGWVLVGAVLACFVSPLLAARGEDREYATQRERFVDAWLEAEFGREVTRRH